MAIYTFYLCARDGASTCFEAFELGGDQQAPARALKLLGEHPSCSYVAVWQGDRPLLEKHRTTAAGRSLDRPVSASRR
ncbi:MAG TPA: hypothetical protein VIE16_06180 [Phenylobacterium sp.]|jgi:hypothetical protein